MYTRSRIPLPIALNPTHQQYEADHRAVGAVRCSAGHFGYALSVQLRAGDPVQLASQRHHQWSAGTSSARDAEAAGNGSGQTAACTADGRRGVCHLNDIVVHNIVDYLFDHVNDYDDHNNDHDSASIELLIVSGNILLRQYSEKHYINPLPLHYNITTQFQASDAAVQSSCRTLRVGEQASNFTHI